MIDRIVVWALTLRERARSERGQDVMEYAVITGTVAVLIVAAILVFSGAASDWFERLGAWFDGNVFPD